VRSAASSKGTKTIRKLYPIAGEFLKGVIPYNAMAGLRLFYSLPDISTLVARAFVV
jgi:hypothetical protein